MIHFHLLHHIPLCPLKPQCTCWSLTNKRHLCSHRYHQLLPGIELVGFLSSVCLISHTFILYLLWCKSTRAPFPACLARNCHRIRAELHHLPSTCIVFLALRCIGSIYHHCSDGILLWGWGCPGWVRFVTPFPSGTPSLLQHGDHPFGIPADDRVPWKN